MGPRTYKGSVPPGLHCKTDQHPTSHPAEDKLSTATLCHSESERQSVQGSQKFLTIQAQGRKVQEEDIRLPTAMVCGDLSHSLENTKERRPYVYFREMHSSEKAPRLGSLMLRLFLTSIFSVPRSLSRRGSRSNMCSQSRS